MAKEQYSKKSLIIIFSLVGFSLLSAIIVGIFGVEIDSGKSPYANSYSKSAVGHKLFAKVLRAVDIPVSISTFSTDNKAANRSLLMLLEPTAYINQSKTKTTLKQILRASSNTLVVLPKWNVVETQDRKGWVDTVTLHDSAYFAHLFKNIDTPGISVITATNKKQEWDTPFAYNPTIPMMQLMVSNDLTPIIECDEGILLGSYDSHNFGEIFILSDPDLIANFNISSGDNAKLAVAIIDSLREENEGVIIDEMTHGFIYHKSVWRMLFEFPNVTLLISAILTAAVALWAGVIRTRKADTNTQRERWGKAYLVMNSANLITSPKHRQHTLTQYVRNTLYSTARAKGVTCDMHNLHEMAEKLVKLSGSYIPITVVKEIQTQRRLTSEQMAKIAQKINRWKEEFTNGTA